MTRGNLLDISFHFCTQAHPPGRGGGLNPQIFTGEVREGRGLCIMQYFDPQCFIRFWLKSTSVFSLKKTKKSLLGELHST